MVNVIERGVQRAQRAEPMNSDLPATCRTVRDITDKKTLGLCIMRRVGVSRQPGRVARYKDGSSSKETGQDWEAPRKDGTY